MTAICCSKRLKRMHNLIRLKATGQPEKFAARLEISQATLFRNINELRNLGAIIYYSKEDESYVYDEPFNLDF
jgi:predicted DNA-binding transcriptional regulator YafY